MVRLDPAYAPDPKPRPKPLTRCARACCWTPFGHASREGCKCHPKED